MPVRDALTSVGTNFAPVSGSVPTGCTDLEAAAVAEQASGADESAGASLKTQAAPIMGVAGKTSFRRVAPTAGRQGQPADRSGSCRALALGQPRAQALLIGRRHHGFGTTGTAVKVPMAPIGFTLIVPLNSFAAVKGAE